MSSASQVSALVVRVTKAATVTAKKEMTTKTSRPHSCPSSQGSSTMAKTCIPRRIADGCLRSTANQ
jgi:hypothetical protein